MFEKGRWFLCISLICTAAGISSLPVKGQEFASSKGSRASSTTAVDWKNVSPKTIDAIKLRLKFEPNNWQLLNAMGVIYAHQQSYELAAEYLDKASKANPTNATLLLNLSVVYDHLQQYDRSLSAVEDSLKLRPDDPTATQQKCELLLITEQFKKAAPCYEKLTSLVPNDMTAMARYSFALVGSGDLAHAESLAASAAERFPGSPEIQNSLGMIAYEKKDFEAARTAFGRAVELDPNFAPARFNLALAELVKNRRSQALEQYGYMKRTNPDLADQLYQILFGNLLVVAGNQPKLKH